MLEVGGDKARSSKVRKFDRVHVSKFSSFVEKMNASQFKKIELSPIIKLELSNLGLGTNCKVRT